MADIIYKEFNRPSVIVYQELTLEKPNPTAPYMHLCLISPLYQVLKDTPVKNENFGGQVNYLAGTKFYASFPLKQNLSRLDPEAVTATITSGTFVVWPLSSLVTESSTTPWSSVVVDNSGLISEVSLAPDSTSENFTSASTRIGDTVILKIDADTMITTKVAKIVDPDTVNLARNIPSPAGALGATFDAQMIILRDIERPVTLRPTMKDLEDPTPVADLLESNTFVVKEDEFGLSALLTVEMADLNVIKRIYSGNVTVSYRALRRDGTGDTLQIDGITAATAIFGPADLDNPLSVAAQLINVNVPISYTVQLCESDTVEGYVKAIERLTTNKSTYIPIVLTDNQTVQDAVVAHCKAMSEPKKGKERVTYLSSGSYPVEKAIIDQNDGIFQWMGDRSVGYIVDAVNGRFGTFKVAPGDFVNLHSGPFNVYAEVDSLINETILLLTPYAYERTPEGFSRVGTLKQAMTTLGWDPMEDMAANATYEISRMLSPHGVAESQAEKARSYFHKRVRYIPSDGVDIPINGKDHRAPAWYLSVVMGALRAGLPPQQGMTNLSISGISRIYGMANFFTDDDIDLMAVNGCMIITQDTSNSKPYCLYQTTTSSETSKEREDSMVACVDFASKYLRDLLSPLIGVTNVTDEVRDKVAMRVNTGISELQKMSYQDLGGVITGGELLGIDTDQDRIIPIVKIYIPYPVNNIILYLNV